MYGANKSLVAGAPPEAAVLVGLCNAVGGGLLRDVIVREEPLLLKPGQLYFLATLVGCIGFVVLSHHYGWRRRARRLARDRGHHAAAPARHPASTGRTARLRLARAALTGELQVHHDHRLLMQ